MRHRFKKTKFGRGYDFDKMMIRKLSNNFLLNNHLETTLSRIKKIKPVLESLISKMKKDSESNKNLLLKYLDNNEVIEKGFKIIGPAITKINGGYLKIIKIGTRNSDGSEEARLEWAHKIVFPESVKKETDKVKPVKQEKEVKKIK